MLRRRLPRFAIWLVLAVILLGLPDKRPESSWAQSSLVDFTVDTEPDTSGLPIRLRDISSGMLVANENTTQSGNLSLAIPAGTYQLETELQVNVKASSRIHFSQWTDLTNSTAFEASRPINITQTMTVKVLVTHEHRISLSFTDLEGLPVDSNLIEGVSMQANDGQLYNLTSYENIWFTSNRFQRTPGDWRVVNTTYNILSIEVGGQNVVQRGLFVFTPLPDAVWVVRLQVYTLTVTVSDLFFGFPIQMNVRLMHLDSGDLAGSSETLAGMAIFENFPKGDYVVRVAGAGVALPVPVIFTKSMTIEVKVFSLVDGFFLASIATVVFGIFLFFRRNPNYSARLREGFRSFFGLGHDIHD